MALNNDNLFLVNQDGDSKRITFQNLKSNIAPKNLIINGDFRVNQRNGTRTPGVGVYGFDRWRGHADGLEQVVEDVAEGDYVLSWEGGGSGSFGGQTGESPLSASVGGAGDKSVIVPSDATNVQLISGTLAAPFEQRSLQTETLLCYRYFQTISLDGLVYNANSDVVDTKLSVPLKAPMRLSSPEIENREEKTRVAVSLGPYSINNVDNYYKIDGISGCNAPLATAVLVLPRINSTGQNLVTICGRSEETQFTLDAEIYS